MKYTYFFLITISIFLYSCSSNGINNSASTTNDSLKVGFWKGELTIQNQRLPFLFYVDSAQTLLVYNGKDKLQMKKTVIEGDSAIVYFNDYPTYLTFKAKENQKMNGFFINPDHDFPVPFTANYVGENKIDLTPQKSISKTVAGKWQVQFRWNTDNPYDAIGKIDQNKNLVTGTFLKNSGDAGFLRGFFNEDTLTLYKFNGSTAAIYKAHLENDTLKGIVLSGESDTLFWKGFRNEDFTLKNPFAMTHLLPGKELKLQFTTLAGEEYHYPNDATKGKVTLIQIMGTWCPNCLDESIFFKNLYEKYHSKGLEIIAVAYERPTNFEGQVKRVKRFIESQQMPYPFLIGGTISSDEVNKDFNMLSHIGIFPTTLYINKKGVVEKIHTGFSGPGTGKLFEEYKKETTQFIEQLLND